MDGKVGLVTGSGRGLGRACAEAFAREGARVAIVDLNSDDGEAAAQSINANGGEAIFIRANVGVSEDIQRMVAAVEEKFGRLDFAVNNAVCNIGRMPLADIDDETWERGAAVNISGVFYCMKYQIQAMLRSGGGAIVNIGSGNEHSSQPGLAWYLGAKQAVYGMTKCAALDYAKQNIRINAVGPGSMWTPALRQTAKEIPEHIERLSAMSPLGRISEPEEVAEAVLWLCSPRASYVLGHTLVADGGAVLG